MENLSLEAKHLLKMMQTDGKNRGTPLRNDKELAAMQELEAAGLVLWRGWPNGSMYFLSFRGYDRSLTKL